MAARRPGMSGGFCVGGGLAGRVTRRSRDLGTVVCVDKPLIGHRRSRRAVCELRDDCLPRMWPTATAAGGLPWERGGRRIDRWEHKTAGIDTIKLCLDKARMPSLARLKEQ